MPSSSSSRGAHSRSEPVAKRLAAASFADIVGMEREMPRDWVGVVTGIGAVRQFEDLRLPCSLVTANQRDWLKIWGTDDNVVAHELLHGAEAARSEYDHRCLALVTQNKKPLIASHAGFFDAFVPIVRQGRVLGFLVSGSFATSAWKAPEIREQWQKLSGRPPRAGDPELLAYAEAVLSTPVFGRSTARAFLAMLSVFAEILAHPERASTVRARWHRLTQRHLHRRLHYNMWQMAAGLVDPVQQAAWSAARRAWIRRYLGLTRLPTLVLALASRAPADRDPLQALVDDHRFLLDCADVALEIEDAACGRAGSVPYLLLHCDAATTERAGRRAVRRLIEEVRTRLSKRGHDRVHVGASSLTQVPSGLARCLREALFALEWAVHTSEALVFHEDRAKAAVAGAARFAALSDLLRALREGASAEATLALEALVSEIVWESAANVTSARAYVDGFFSQALHALGDLDLLEPSVVSDHSSAFRQAIDRAPTVNASVTAFRDHVLQLIDARTHPRSTRRDTKLDRAIHYLEEQVSRDVTLAEAAQVAGYAPRYFSRLLFQLRGQTFEQILLSLRLARAKELLRSSDLVVAEVAVGSGFRSLAYFHRVFRRESGMTPAAFRSAQRAPSGARVLGERRGQKDVEHRS